MREAEQRGRRHAASYGARGPTWRAHLAALVASVVLVTPSSGAAAQADCLGRPVNISGVSPRVRDSWLRAPTVAHELVREGVRCDQDSTAVIIVERAVPVVGNVRAALQHPLLRGAHLSGFADARHMGQMWSGRGGSLLIRPAVSIDHRYLHAVFAPVIWGTENGAFHYFRGRDTTRSPFSSPWYSGAFSLDLPSQHGLDPFVFFDLGETAVWTSVAGIDAGFSSASQAWGPGARAHLLLGPDIAGVPRLFARTARPLRTPVGLLSGGGFAGTLTESRFFDRDARNDLRRLWAWNAELRPDAAGRVAIGVAHGVLLSGPGFFEGEADQLFTLSAQIRDAAGAGRIWAEIGRMGTLPSIRRFLTTPYDGIAYVVGFERSSRVAAASKVLVSAEAMSVEQPTDIRGEGERDFYSGSTIPQGWTHRGRVLGVPTGPGTQSQWLAVDWIAPRWSLGVFGERVRWNEDAFLREYLAYPNRHDVSVRGGIRLGVSAFGYEMDVAGSLGRRLNYLFQNATYLPTYRTVDVVAPQVRFTLSPLSP